MGESSARALEILLVEDSPSDIELTAEAFMDLKMRNNVHFVDNGVQAMEFLRRQGTFPDAPRPDLIILDLNLPRKDGREVLAEIKADDDLRTIPIIVLTTSQAEDDVLQAYRLNCNCYVKKPVNFTEFLAVIRSIEDFWLSVVTLPPKPRTSYAKEATDEQRAA